MEDTRYAYTVNPRRPIRGIAGIKSVRTGTTLRLTKEEVKIAMKCGHVYRRFANEGINQRVTGDNLDRLHNEKFMNEKEYEEFLHGSTAKVDTDSKVEEKPSVEVSKEETKPVEDTPVQEEVTEEFPELEDTTSEDTEEVVENNNDDNSDVKNDDVEVEDNSEQPVDTKDVEQTDEQDTIEDVPVSDETIDDEDSDPELSNDENSDDDEELEDNNDNSDSNSGNNYTPVITANYNGGGKKKNRKHRN